MAKDFHSCLRCRLMQLASLLALLTLAGRVAQAQAPAWQMAVAPLGGPLIPGRDYSGGTYATATDAAGNVYLAGVFAGTFTFGATTLTSATTGSNDIFVAKWSPVSKDFVWARQAGSPGGYGVSAIAVNGVSIYLTGVFVGATASFGSTTLTNAAYAGPSSSKYNGFIAKLTDAGTTASFTWAQAISSPGAAYPAALAVGSAGVYVAGSFAGSATFGAIGLVSTGQEDGFVAKLIDGGATASFSWVQQAGGSGNEAARGLAVNNADVYATGYFGGPSAAFAGTTLTALGYGSIFVAKLTDAGSTSSLIWVQKAGGTNFDDGAALAVSGTSVYVAGHFQSQVANFGSVSLTSTNYNNHANVFVAKLIDAGSTSSFVWAQRVGGNNATFVNALAANGSAIYITGKFVLNVAFGNTTLVSGGATSSGYYDVFVAKLTDAGATGSFNWATRAGGASHSEGYALALSGTSIYAGGRAGLATSFGSLPLTSHSSIGVPYLASLTDNGTLAAIAPTQPVAVSVYPNPAHTTTRVTIPAIPNAPLSVLTLVNTLGQVVRTQTLSALTGSFTTDLSLQGLVPGLYHLRVQAGSYLVACLLTVE